jgi:biopolymer transport protein TolR
MAMSTGKAEINVTPMIDVLLVLIIIFMVVVPQNSVGLPAAVPQPAQAESMVRESDIVVSVSKNGSITINSEPVALERLQERLRAIFAARANKVIFLRGDGSLDFEQIATVIDIAKGADVFHIGLMTE